LIEKKRVAEIPAIAEELRVLVAKLKNQFEGTIFTQQELSSEDVNSLSNGLSQKLGKNVTLNVIKSESSDLKVVVDDLNVTISLSKNRIEADIINHILKAI
jgi:F-type H+-transporting ATPase subunit delta